MDPSTQDSVRKPRVLVLFGGPSPEHSVSCVTASGVLGAIDRERFDVVAIGITRAGQWTQLAENSTEFSFSNDELPEVRSTSRTVHLRTDFPSGSTPSCELVETAEDGSARSLGTVDVAFPLLHGPYGEDGTLQGLLESAGVRYVGPGVIASAVGMDKHFMKLAFKSAGLQVGPWETFLASEWDAHRSEITERLTNLTLPLFVKPARGGSSVGVSMIRSLSELDSAIDEARKHDSKIVVEQGINGREIECGVLGGLVGEPARASMLGEITVASSQDTDTVDFYDFQAKYTNNLAAETVCPADLPESVASEIRQQALVAFNAIGAEHISRVDFFWTDDQQIIINEINTMPGFTPISMY